MSSQPAWVAAALERIRTKDVSVAVLGCGYVGLTLAAEAARTGLQVVGVEADEGRAKELRSGTIPVPDVALSSDDLAATAERLTFAPRLERPADVYVICVNTPLRDGSPDLTHVEAAGEAVGGVLERGALVVLESTTYPGTTEELLGPRLEGASGLRPGDDFALAHSPERINPADRTWMLRNTPKVVGATTPWGSELACAFYAHVCSEVVPVSSPRTAEMTKLLENTYREVNIALANEMATICRDFDIDPWEVVDAASTKPYGFTPFRPGPGTGGHCVPVDPQYLAWRVRGKAGRQFRLLETASDVNQRMPHYCSQRAAEILNERGKAVRGAKVLLLGVAYKGGSGDVRESPALRVADRLAHSGADLTYHDPYVRSVQIDGRRYEGAELTDALVADADLVIVTTDHPDVDYGRVLALADVVYDTRGVTRGLAGGRATVHTS